MLRTTQDLANYAIEATDGPIGHVKDFYFDDDAWVIRYLVVDAGSWLSSRKVLISPISIHPPTWAGRELSASITKEQVRNSPGVDTDKPVSRQYEEEYMGYYGYANYWGGAGVWGSGMYPYAMIPGYGGFGVDRVEREREMEAGLRAERARHRNDDPHLRSCKAVAGYHIQANDGEIGHVADYLIDEQTWAIRYLVVDTSNWWVGHKVLVAPEWISGVHWPGKTVSVDMSRAAVKSAPAYDPNIDWSREGEQNLYQHYGRTGHWAGVVTSESEV
jgi:hypothetical protein